MWCLTATPVDHCVEERGECSAESSFLNKLDGLKSRPCSKQSFGLARRPMMERDVTVGTPMSATSISFKLITRKTA